MEIDHVKLADAVYNVRNKRPLRELATELSISASTISRIENGCIPDLPAFLKICEWLKVQPNHFIMQSANKEPVVRNIKLEIIDLITTDPALSPKVATVLTKIVNELYALNNL